MNKLSDMIMITIITTIIGSNLKGLKSQEPSLAETVLKLTTHQETSNITTMTTMITMTTMLIIIIMRKNLT